MNVYDENDWNHDNTIYFCGACGESHHLADAKFEAHAKYNRPSQSFCKQEARHDRLNRWTDFNSGTAQNRDFNRGKVG